MDGVRILILEEEYLIAEDIRLFLTDAGYEVDVSFSVFEAIARASTFRPNLLILGSISKRGLSEVEVADRIESAVSAAVKIIFLVSRPISLHGFTKISQSLFKPFKNEELLETVRLLSASDSDRPRPQ